MKPLSKRAAQALEILKAGGCFVADPEYSGTDYTLCTTPDGEPVDGFGRRGRARAARFELLEAGYAFDEVMDGRNFIIGRIIETTEARDADQRTA